jgi:hypothetical protein
MATAKKKTKAAPAKKKKAAAKKASGKSSTAKKVAVAAAVATGVAVAAAATAAAVSGKSGKEGAASVDRKALSAKARSLKTELLAIRFNLQSPNLNEYRKKRRELAATLAQLG